MRLFHIAFLTAHSLCASALSAIVVAINRIAAFVEAAFPATKPLALAGPYGMPREISGQKLDRSMTNGLRHEAGVSRRAAPRRARSDKIATAPRSEPGARWQ